MKRLILTICIALFTLTGLAQRNGQYPGLGGGGSSSGGGITNNQSGVTLTGQFLATGIYNNLTNVLSANYQILTSNIAVFGGGNPGGTAQVITLPITPNFTNNYGAYWWIFCTNASGSIIVTNANGTELINGATSLTISGISSINLQSDMNSNYWTVGNPNLNVIGTINYSSPTSYQANLNTNTANSVGGFTNLFLDDVISENGGYAAGGIMLSNSLHLRADTNGVGYNAADIGYTLSSNRLVGVAVSVSTGTPVNITNIVCPRGTWLVFSHLTYVSAAATVPTSFGANVSTTTAAFTIDGFDSYLPQNSTSTDTGSVSPLPRQFTFNVATTIYLVAKASFTGGTVTAYGGLTAVRQ